MAESPAESEGSAPSFEEAIEQVEHIIDRIESGEAGLEQCLSEYERGMKLIRRCRDVLDTAERRIAELVADAEGGLRVDEDDRSDAALPTDESDDPS